MNQCKYNMIMLHHLIIIDILIKKVTLWLVYKYCTGIIYVSSIYYDVYIKTCIFYSTKNIYSKTYQSIY